MMIITTSLELLKNFHNVKKQLHPQVQYQFVLDCKNQRKNAMGKIIGGNTHKMKMLFITHSIVIKKLS